MNVLLVAVNAKYIHSNPAVYSLAAYAGKMLPEFRGSIEVVEYTINQPPADILADLYQRKPDMVGFSCYIWNIAYVYSLIPELKKVLPDVDVWLGGPEVSYDAQKVIKEHSELTGIMVGEGEATFTDLLDYYGRSEADADFDPRGEGWRQIPGIVVREKGSGEIFLSETRKLTDLSAIPFLYQDLSRFENRIIYYESSRGCPFRCSYCLSSIDKRLRFRDIHLVKKELQFFLDHKVKQVKFVDRTFNCSHTHAMEIWQYIKDHDNGITNFHFEIAADILNEEELALINTFRPGAVQMEIGVQSANPRTLREIDRQIAASRPPAAGSQVPADEDPDALHVLRKVVERIHRGRNVHIHLDLIAGLPYEDFSSFQNSFNEVFAMEPEQLQLGFLKVLKGSKMHRKAEEYGIAYTDTPNYEVLYTKWISYDEILILKRVEEMVEIYYNSNQFRRTLPLLLRQFETPFALFESLAGFYHENGYFVQTPSRSCRYQILVHFAQMRCPDLAQEFLKETLVIDYYLRENAKSRPDFAGEIGQEREFIREFWRQESRTHRWLAGEDYLCASAKELARMAHLEPVHYDLQTGELLKDTAYLLFDYWNRSPLTHEAGLVDVTGHFASV